MVGTSRGFIAKLITDIIFLMGKGMVGGLFWGELIIQVWMRRSKRVHPTLIFLSFVYICIFIFLEAGVI